MSMSMSMSNFNVLILCALDKFAGGYPPVLSNLIEALINQYSLLPSQSTPVEVPLKLNSKPTPSGREFNVTSVPLHWVISPVHTVYYAGSNLTQDKSKKKCSAYLQANFPELCGYKPEMFDMVLLDHCPLTNDKTVMSPYLLDKIKHLLKPSGLFLFKNTGEPVRVIMHNPIAGNTTNTLHGDDLKAYTATIAEKRKIPMHFADIKKLAKQYTLHYIDNVSGYVDIYATGHNKAVDWVIFQKPPVVQIAEPVVAEHPAPEPAISASEDHDQDKIKFIQLA